MANTTFSPRYVGMLIVEPLRYFFANFAGEDLKWSDDVNSKIDIAKVNDFYKKPVEIKPRILIDRGTYQITGVGLTDNMAESPTIASTKGLNNRINMVMISGSAEIIIEATNEGVCELVTDMVTHFLTWSRPQICDTLGLKVFGIPMQVTQPSIQEENGIEKFTVRISIPYQKEELWSVNEDALKLKQFTLDLSTALS